ncbi:YesL family protein [Bianquea renquensis]|jgi:hypothetical protein|uniref:DUF624 domain-containing protein n=1 Tax=Bianquea renquensis TaxID=2763661 RepID=A0A926DS87_9FIRM|nr:DUF624 domain-containing protein [Bianquea renquensis]MBC8543646.1 DUF624 domain-containing protein [Bianquea renquensis]
MAGFFSLDGPFVKYGTLVFDMIYLNVLWLFMGGPLIILLLMSTGLLGVIPPAVGMVLLFLIMLHSGVATTALSYTLGKKQRGTESYTFRDFWHGYKTNYKQAIIVSLILSLLFCLLGWNLYLLTVNAGTFGKMVYVLLPLQLFVALELLFVSIYIYPLLARFEMKTKDLFRYSFFMANKHLLTTILCTALLVGAFALCLLVNLLFAFVVVSVYIYISVALLERVFKNYMPSEDDALEEEEIEGFNLDAERQAIIDQYLGKGKFNPDIDGSEEEYRIVKVNEDGQEEVEEDEYKVVLVNDDGAGTGVEDPDENKSS